MAPRGSLTGFWPARNEQCLVVEVPFLVGGLAREACQLRTPRMCCQRESSVI